MCSIDIEVDVRKSIKLFNHFCSLCKARIRDGHEIEARLFARKAASWAIDILDIRE